MDCTGGRAALAAAALALGWMVPSAAAQETEAAEMLSVLEGSLDPGPRITPYLRHQLDLAWRQDEQRRARFARVRTEADLLALRKEMKARVLDIIGGLPATRTPLNARITGTVRMTGYRIEKVVFESLPGLHVTALVYVPDQPSGPRPAVLVPCGHAPDGKSFKNYQELSGQLALRGYVVISWDPVGQGERSQYWDAARGRSRYNLVCGEHAVLGNLACVTGSSLIRYMVWDGMRALDYLLTRPDVDGTRIAVTGTSGGGFQSLYLGALDERITVVAPSCFVTSLPMRMANRIFDDPDSDPEQDPYGLVSAGVDHPGLLLLIYPRPVILLAATKDFFPIEGTRKTFRELRALYSAFGHGDRIAMAEGVHGHMYSPENRRAAFAFIDRFHGLPARHALDPITILEAPALRCTPTGQVRVDLQGRSLPEVIREEWRARPRAPKTVADLYRSENDPGIARWTVAPKGRGPAPAGVIAWEAAGTSRAGHVVIDRYRLHHGEHLVIPVLHVRREGSARGPAVLVLSLEGKPGAGAWAAVQRRLDAGEEVVTFDFRGVGETGMRYRAASGDDPTLAEADEKQAYFNPLSGVLANHVYNSHLTGRPYFLEMIDDVAIVARFAGERLGAARLSVAALGEAGLLADEIPGVLANVTRAADSPPPTLSWRAIADEMREIWPIAYLLPGGALLRPAR